MTAAKSSNGKKGLYHSELVRMGEVEIEVLSDRKESKFPGKNDYVVLRVDGAG